MEADLEKEPEDYHAEPDWSFRINNQAMSALNFKDLEKPHLSKLGERFLSSVLLSDMITCMHGGNQISKYFECPPPSLSVYLSAPRPANPRAGARIDLLFFL